MAIQMAIQMHRSNTDSAGCLDWFQGGPDGTGFWDSGRILEVFLEILSLLFHGCLQTFEVSILSSAPLQAILNTSDQYSKESLVGP